MKVKIKKGKAAGFVEAPPSKSMAHRLLICAGLADGISEIEGIAESQDILATIDCLSALGAECERMGDDACTMRLKGAGDKIWDCDEKRVLKCRESGSTLRFFVPLCLLSGVDAELTGSGRLMERPMDVYKKLCGERGLMFVQEKDSLTVKGPLKAGTFRIAGNISSQFISGLLLAVPLLEGASRLEIIPPVESRSYIEMTLSALKTFDISFERPDENTILINGGQRYRPQRAKVEGDYSNAAFFQALDMLGGGVDVGNLKTDSLQGDKVCGEMLKRLGEGRPELDISDCPDLGPVLFAAAAATGRGAVFTGTKRLKIKESDRGSVMAQVLDKFGVEVVMEENRIVIGGGGIKTPAEALYGYNDHRIVMSEAVLLSMTGGIIEGAEAVSKSFPDFFEKLGSLGIEVEKIED